MALTKSGDPPKEWQQHRTHAGLSTLPFGVLDPRGASIRGMHVEFAALRRPRLAGLAWKLTLFSLQNFRLLRIYQLENPGRAGMRPGDHDFPHEHVLDVRQPENPQWREFAFPAMLEHVCRQCTLTLTDSPPDIDAFALR